MRYTVSTVSLSYAIVAMLMALSVATAAQDLHELVSYEVIPSCVSPNPDKPALPNQFFYRLTINKSAGEEHFEIVIDGDPLVQFNVTPSDIPYVSEVGPFTHSIVGGSYHQYILRSLSSEIADTLFLPEVVCGHGTDNGFNAPGYYCNGLEGGIVAQAAPEKLESPSVPEKMYTYILLNLTTGLVEAKNFSGHFTQVSDLSNYEMHAFATSFEEAAGFINSIEVGEPLDREDLSICFAFCGAFEVSTDCSSFDLRLQKDSRDITVHSYGDTAVFDITIINEGRVTAYNIRVRDNIPEGLLFEPSLNPEWNEDATSTLIDSVLAGEAHIIPIRLIVDPSSSFIDIVNVAEIISGTIDIDKDIDAFDRDSSPDNDLPTEDDQDDAEITVIENLCNSTFEVVLTKEPSCEGVDIVLTPEVLMSNEPVTWRWRYEGRVISREQILVMREDEVDPFGRYELTAIDNMGCVKVMVVDINMIDNNDRLSCYSDINVGVNENCQLNIHPAMLTGNRPPGIDDYEIRIEDEEGNLVNTNDISLFGPDDVLMASLINPCTREVLCWTNLHIENKLFPQFELYTSPFKTVCLDSELSATAAIDNFNRHYNNQILSAEQFQESLHQSSCIQEWEVDVIDQIIPGRDMCDEVTVMRVYQLYDQESPYPLDTAFLTLNSILFEDIILPEDVDNIPCGDEVDPSSLASIPSYVIGNDTILLGEQWAASSSFSLCNLGITNSDEVLSEHCVWGAKKIMRTWSFGDWCTNQNKQHIQFLYIIDREAPIIEALLDTITITAEPYQCHVEITPSDYATVSDNCNEQVSFLQGGEAIELPLGYHRLPIEVSDPCENTAIRYVIFHVVESTPPIAVLHDVLTLNFATDTSSADHYINAIAFDAGSHDSQCGPVTIEIARKSEVDLLELTGGLLEESDGLTCTDLMSLDTDLNGSLADFELFRQRVDICCSDIGRIISLIVLITDQSGNETRAEVQLEVTAKLEWIACDDGDPCTADDRLYGECGCVGQPVTSDVDGDGALDCNDEEIVVCLNGQQLEVSFLQIDSLIQLGAIGGYCNKGELAVIAGEVRTPIGEPIDAVEIYTNSNMMDMTSVNGTYALPPQEMYKKYELLPIKNDDALNGVSAVDLVILQEYILGLRPLDDPYLLIAADVNGDGKLSAADVVDMQRLLLGQRNTWKGNRSWRFVIENFEWDDIQKPWPFQEINVISSLESNMLEENWIGIKTGDLNQDASPNENLSSSRSSDVYVMHSKDQRLEKGESTTLRFLIDNESEEIEGLQVRLDVDDLIIRAINSGDLNISSKDYHLEKDNMTIVWAKNESGEIRSSLFEIEVEAIRDLSIKESIQVNEHYPSIVVKKNDVVASLQLDFRPGETIVSNQERAVMFQNQPNPFTGQTVVQFVIPAKNQVSFQFYGTNGELLYEKSGEYGSGNNAISLTHEDLRYYQGAIYYQMRYQGQIFTRTMVLTK